MASPAPHAPVPVPHSRLAVTEHGRVSAPAVVLVHGIGASGRYFRPLVQALQSTHRVVVPDLLGFGSGDRPRPALGIAGHAAALERVLDERGLERPLLLGHSMGSQVVVEMAARRPDRAHGVVLVGPVVDPVAPTAAGQARRLARDTVAEPPGLAALVLREYARSVRAFGRSLPHMLAYPTARRLAAVTAPVVVVRGGRDPVTSRAFVQALAAAAPSGSWQEVAGARHLTMATRPETVAAICRAVAP